MTYSGSYLLNALFNKKISFRRHSTPDLVNQLFGIVVVVILERHGQNHSELFIHGDEEAVLRGNHPTYHA